MKKEILLCFGITFLFLGTCITPSVAIDYVKKSSIPLNSGNTLYVGGTGPGNYTKIQDAIDDANDGDTVFVYDDSSPYYESLIIEKSINLIGENKETTIIDAFVYIIIEAHANEFSIEHFTVRGGEVGLYGTLNNSIISDNIFSCYSVCIALDISSNNMILNNQLENSIEYRDYGIGLFSSNGNIITGNIIENCGKGIWLIGAIKNKITKNTFRNNFLHGIFIKSSFLNIITKNNFLNNPDHIYFNKSSYNLYFRNYWDDWSSLGPRPIKGTRYWVFLDKTSPWTTYDLRPAKEQYDI
ncbi:MAG: right-handed parallel beta-helix repeat-containing protein [Thermoplasmatales archaeon]|nr:MAG: right-handed parallel beta-helix repeat-containing protein [Thermoplasmatales archaeon]